MARTLTTRDRLVVLPEPGHRYLLPTGETITVGKRLGNGAFGLVHEAVDDFDNALVVKTLSPRNRTYEEIKANWEREIQALSTLRHPHITHVYSWFEHQNAFSIVIERCTGTLKDLFAMPGYDGSVWMRPIARCILSGIHFVHSQGYVHKDIHSGNIFWLMHRNEMDATPASSVTFKIGDLGISRLATEIDFFGTVLAQWMLPPEFLAPDRFGYVGPQTDIYHAGLLLLSVWHGQDLQFEKSQILDGLPRSVAADLPPPWGPALEKALRRTVAQRTQTAVELWRDLQQP
ncbi:serine/threonine protein kinase [Polyangium fumosum]|uniref:non-specific serine/threonine protein kinase n=1 Tax=Polyangium fumosum TaxID=889272 RepID=A0A4U1J7R5_9BACT|nr:protein kinase family protein [Polyangium fumosum]TKD03429.1 protein kinase family protein [Polyangium fumosum]